MNDWQCHPEAEQLLLKLLSAVTLANSFCKQLESDLKERTSTRLFDWVDHFLIGKDSPVIPKLKELGFQASEDTLFHPGAQFPRLHLQNHSQNLLGLSVIVESIADFLGMRGIFRPIEGAPFSAYRRSLLSTENAISLFIVERRGTRTLVPIDKPNPDYIPYLEKWKCRPRHDFEYLFPLAEETVARFGQNFAACIVLEAERFYWQNRNFTAAIQKSRQDQLGMGWANHDHHTFRSSIENFDRLVQFFILLGFHCREKFVAGKEAGWKAQVMENAISGHVLFIDVDHSPDTLGTVGLWCALHGDSILEGGMHHLEAQFSFDLLKEDLAKRGISFMPPFSNFPHLHQAFSKGEIWPVKEERLQKLMARRQITEEQANEFRSRGAIGSHLENLERKEGFKGFNQQNVSTIIHATDPRKHL